MWVSMLNWMSNKSIIKKKYVKNLRILLWSLFSAQKESIFLCIIVPTTFVLAALELKFQVREAFCTIIFNFS